jgi:ribosomal protein L37E
VSRNIPHNVVVTAALTCLAIAGLVLTVLGLIGRRVGDHPHCRRCGRDLFGVESDLCPECGRDVSTSASTVIGRRRRRPRLIWLGGTLLILPLALLLATATVDWQNLKPATWLIADLDGDTGFIAAADTLRAKLEARQLDDATVEAAADKLLARQADLEKPWHLAAGQFIEAAWDAGRLDDERWNVYLRHIFWPELQSRPIIRQGDPLPLRLVLPGHDGGFGGDDRGGAKWFAVTIRLGPPVPDKTPDTRIGTKRRSRNFPGTAIAGEDTAAWPTGRHEFQIDAVVGVLEDNPNVITDRLLIATRPHTFRVQVDVRPAEAEQPLLDDRPTFVPPPGAVSCELRVLPPISHGTTEALSASVRVATDQWPRLKDHQVLLSIDGVEVPLQEAMSSYDDVRRVVTYAAPADAVPPGATATMVLRPDHGAALWRVEATPIYDGEVRVENVPVRHHEDYVSPTE